MRLAATAAAVLHLFLLRLTGHTGHMRAVCIALAIIGGCALVAATAIELATGNIAGIGWLLLGPAPFYVAGLAGVFRGPGNRVAAWLLACGAMFMLSEFVGDVVTDLPVVAGLVHRLIVVLIASAANASVVV